VGYLSAMYLMGIWEQPGLSHGWALAYVN